MGRAAGGGVGGRGGRMSGGRVGMVSLGGLGGGRTKRGGWGTGVGLLLLLASDIVGWRGEVGGEVGDGGEEDMVMGSVSAGLGRRRLDGG